MGDEMDPCECLWNHELAMRRLLTLLRQGQSHCTDVDCVNQLPGLPQPPEDESDSFLIMFLMVAFALFMYMLRPRRNQIQDAAKPTANPQDRDGAPPTPPRF